jgi:hypothetical protein
LIDRTQINLVQALGYTDRQAAFLASVAHTSGCFVRRQFSTARNGKGTGKAIQDFCCGIVARGHAAATLIGTCNVYHLCPPVMEYLGLRVRQPPANCFSVKRSLMCLDYVLAHQNYRFLSADEELRCEYFQQDRGLHRGLFPQRDFVFRDGRKMTLCFLERFPIGIDLQTNRTVFSYIDDGDHSPPLFSTWLEDYRPLLEALGNVEVVYVALTDAPFSIAAQAVQQRASAARRCSRIDASALLRNAKRHRTERPSRTQTE